MHSGYSPRSPDGTNVTAPLALACLLLAVALPVLTLYGLCTTSAAAWLGKLGLAPVHVANAQPLARWQAGLAVLLGMLPVGAMVYGLLRARRCVLGCARGEGLSPGTVRHLRGFASGILVAAVAGMVVPPVVGVLLTLDAPAGQRSLVLSVGSSELLLLLFAGLVWQIAHVMTQAVALAEDHAQIV